MLLLGGGLVYLALGELKESIILLIFGIVSTVITVVQETRTERVLEALRDAPSRRIGFPVQLLRVEPAKPLSSVPGDLLELAANVNKRQMGVIHRDCRLTNRSI